MSCCCNSPNRYERLDNKLERKMMEVKNNSIQGGNTSFRSVNSIILRFPRFEEGSREIQDVFELYDEDSNETIDNEELKRYFLTLDFQCTEQEIRDLFESCDVDGSNGIQFNKFTVLLCLIYLLAGPSSSSHATSTVGSPELKATFDTIIEAFLFLDKNGDGKLNKKDMMKAMNEDFPMEKSITNVTRPDSKKWIGTRMVRSALGSFVLFD